MLGRPLQYLNKHSIMNDPHDYGLADEPFNIEIFKKNMRIVFVRYDDIELEFDIIGVHAAIANAFRRLMLSEVPSMAIDKVILANNTSVVQDEVLAHRMGLIPLKADPRKFQYRTEESGDKGTELDTLEYELKVKCTRRKEVKDTDVGNPDTLYKNYNVLSGQIKWIPRGRQAALFTEADVGCVHDDILISKMRPGHEIEMRLLAVKGIGKDHAKFSPVATATYRLMPDIKLNRTVAGKEAFLLQKCFSPGVIGIDANDCAVVNDARYDTCSRNVFRHKQLADAVTIARVRNHYIFNIESVGALKPDEIFVEAVKELKRKCRKFINAIDQQGNAEQNDGD